MEQVAIQPKGASAGEDFQTLFCRRFACKEDSFADKVFRRVLYPHAALLAPIVQRLNQKFFEDDLHVLKQLAKARSLSEVSYEALTIKLSSRSHRRLLHDKFKCRISGRRLLRLAREVFGTE